MEPKPLPQIPACVQGVTIPEHPVDTVEPRRRQPNAPSEPRPRIGREKSLVGRLCGEALAQDGGASERARRLPGQRDPDAPTHGVRPRGLGARASGVRWAGASGQAHVHAGGRRPLRPRWRLDLHGRGAGGAHPLRRRPRADPTGAARPHPDGPHLGHALRPARGGGLRATHRRRLGGQRERGARPRLPVRRGAVHPAAARRRGSFQPHHRGGAAGGGAGRPVHPHSLAARRRPAPLQPDIPPGQRPVVGESGGADPGTDTRRRHPGRAARFRNMGDT